MNDVDVLFDVAKAQREFLLSSPWETRELAAVAVGLLIVAAMLAIVGRRGSRTSTRLFGGATALVCALLGIMFLVGVGARVGQLQRQRQLESWITLEDFDIVEGTISESVLIVNRTKDDPIPTFRIGDLVFPFAANSQNSLLHHYDVGGVIRDGLWVKVHHRKELILQIVSLTASDAPD